jgi:hypothetical protein
MKLLVGSESFLDGVVDADALAGLRDQKLDTARPGARRGAIWTAAVDSLASWPRGL